jgi:methionine biosynthesis protein MetW
LIKGEFYSKGYYAGLAPEPRFRKVLEIAGKLGGKKLLDIGCGDGTYTLVLKDLLKTEETVGIEISPEAVGLAKEKGIKAYQLDIDEEKLPFEDASFDIIYCGEIIEHVFNPDRLLEEIRRTLKPGGRCIITTPNLAGWSNRLALLLGYQPFATSVSPEHEGAGKLMLKGDEGQWGHIRVFTMRALKELLKIHSLKILSVAGCTVSINTTSSGLLMGCIKAMDKVMSVFPSLASRVIVVVEK